MRKWLLFVVGVCVYVAAAAAVSLDSHAVEVGSVHNRDRRMAVMSDDRLWTDSLVPYTYHNGLEMYPPIKDSVDEAIAHWESVTCIRFKYMTNKDIKAIEDTQKYILIKKGKADCYSSVGMTDGVGPQVLSISRMCSQRDAVIHEIGHLVGMWHTHARWDRDAHVVIHAENIKNPSLTLQNFNKHDNMRLLVPYDLTSLMHYDLKMFDKNGERTIAPLHEDLAYMVGLGRDLSFYDVLTVHKLYKCAAKCGPEAPRCENEGFLTKECVCRCPMGLTGNRCERVVTDDDCGGIVKVERKSQHIMSPNFPNVYPDNLNCQWLFKAPRGHLIELIFDKMKTEKAPGGTCKDSIEVRYSPIGVETGPRICGDIPYKKYTSQRSSMMVKFHTNSVYGRQGFRMRVKAIPAQDCASSPCLNNGACTDVPDMGTYVCRCTNMWVGKQCDVPIVDGGYSQWTEWSNCMSTCGKRTRNRACTDPEAQNGGKPCTGSTYQTKQCGTAEECKDSYQCDFGHFPGQDMCGIAQDLTDDMDWHIHHGKTESENTGPPSGHTTGENNDAYLYVEASNGMTHYDTIVWLPVQKFQPGIHCLQFFYHLRGKDMGTLALVQRDPAAVDVGIMKALSQNALPKNYKLLWQRTGDFGDDWEEAHVSVLLKGGEQFGFLGVRGKAYDSDMALDDISISRGPCMDSFSSRGYAKCVHGKRGYKFGPFSMFRSSECLRYNCFCNSDGHIDCPDWAREAGCNQESTDNEISPWDPIDPDQEWIDSPHLPGKDTDNKDKDKDNKPPNKDKDKKPPKNEKDKDGYIWTPGKDVDSTFDNLEDIFGGFAKPGKEDVEKEEEDENLWPDGYPDNVVIANALITGGGKNKQRNPDLIRPIKGKIQGTVLARDISTDSAAGSVDGGIVSLKGKGSNDVTIKMKNPIRPKQRKPKQRKPNRKQKNKLKNYRKNSYRAKLIRYLANKNNSGQ